LNNSRINQQHRPDRAALARQAAIEGGRLQEMTAVCNRLEMAPQAARKATLAATRAPNERGRRRSSSSAARAVSV